MHHIESRFVILGPENRLFLGLRVHFSAQKFDSWGSEGVNVCVHGVESSGSGMFSNDDWKPSN